MYGIFEAEIYTLLYISPCSVSLHMGLLRFGLFEAIDSIENLCTSHGFAQRFLAEGAVYRPAVDKCRNGTDGVCLHIAS